MTEKQLKEEKKKIEPKKRGKVYNRIVTPEDWEKVNRQNKSMMKDFLTEYRQLQKKESTLKQYENDLKIIMIYILKELDNIPITEVSRKEFRDFNIYMQENWNWSNARTNRAFSTIRSMLSYIEEDEDYDYKNNVAKKVKGLPKEKIRNNDDDFFLSFEQIMKLRAELLKRGRLQDAVLLMVAFDSAARRNELHQIKKEGLVDGNKANKVIGKRGTEYRPVYLDDTRELIKQYLEERGEDDVESLWYKELPDGTREPIAYETLYDRIVYMSKILSEIEGKQISFFPHSLRHSRCEVLLQGEDTRILDKDGKPVKFTLDQVQKLLNHSDVSTTQSYAKDHSEDEIDEMFGFK